MGIYIIIQARVKDGQYLCLYLTLHVPDILPPPSSLALSRESRCRSLGQKVKERDATITDLSQQLQANAATCRDLQESLTQVWCCSDGYCAITAQTATVPLLLRRLLCHYCSDGYCAITAQTATVPLLLRRLLCHYCSDGYCAITAQMATVPLLHECPRFYPVQWNPLIRTP